MQQFQQFLDKLQAHVIQDFDKFIKGSDRYPRLSLEKGSKYTKIVSADADGGSRSVFGFIENSTGNLWKAATWKAPAKNFPRGHIDGDVTKIRWTGIS